MKKKHRLTALLTAFCLMLTMLPISSLPALAADGALAGDGTEESPYQIADADDLKAFRDLVNDGKTGAWAVLTANIDLNPDIAFAEDGTPTGGTPEEWVPIGAASSEYAGTFNGNGYTISGLYIYTASRYQGLFSAIKTGAVVQNLTIENSYVHGGNYTGALTGRNRGKILDCSNAGTVVGGSYTGGLAGSSENNSSTIIHCINTGKVTGDSTVGGIVGHIDTYSAVTGCSNTGDVNGTGTVGGIVGWNNRITCTISDCHNTGSITTTGAGTMGYYAGGISGRNSGNVQNCGNTGSVSAVSNAGGITGGHSSGSITGCVNTGDVTTTGSDCAGGLVGLNQNASIANSYNTGDVTAATSRAGGLVGSNYTGGSIQNCYSTGTIRANQYAGGAVGQNSGAVENCGYLDSCGKEGEGTSYSETAMKSAEFAAILNAGQDPAPFQADFSTLGGYLNDGYPILTWQTPFAGGSGVEGDPFLISTKEELEAFRDYVNDGSTGIWGTLINSIDLNPGYTFHEDGSYTYSGEGKESTPEQWEPIGNYSDEYRYYAGTFDGNGCTVSGVYIHNSSSYQGLFGRVHSGTVKRLGLVNSDIQGASYVGGIAGQVIDSTIADCYNTGTVAGYGAGNTNIECIGGIAGDVTGGAVEGCYNTGAVSGNSILGRCDGTGGIVGQLAALTWQEGTITGCYNTGAVSGNSYTGGVVGEVTGSTVENCYNVGSVTHYSGHTELGGVAGRVFSGNIIRCYNAGAVSGSFNVGGVAGSIYDEGTVEDCYYLAADGLAGVGSGDGGTIPLTAEQMTGPNALSEGNMSALDSSLWTAGGEAGTEWEYLGANPDGTGSYGTMGYLPQLTVFADAGKGHEEIPVQITAGLQQEVGSDGKTYYLIYTADQLKTFRNIVNNTLTEAEAGIYTADAAANGKLEADIVLNEDFDQDLFAVDADGNLTYDGGDVPTNFEQWEPIGSGSYAGTFDGDYHTVSGVYINNDLRYQSLFGCVDGGGMIQNLGVVNSYISAHYASGVVSLSYGPVQNCYNAGNINASSDGAYAGGVVALSRGSVQNCYNTGSVSASGDHAYVGGVVALSYGSVQNCYNTGNINASGNNAYVGGMVGFESNDVNVQNCYNAGSINASGDDAYAGGVVGFQSHNGSTQNCYFLEGTAGAGIGHELGTVDSVTSLTAEQMTGSDALNEGNMSALDSSLWTPGDDNTVWKYLGNNEDNTGSYGVIGYLPQLTAFVDAGQGHEKIPVETTTGLRQETVNGTMYYLIYTADQLKTFRDIVNNTLTGDDAALYTADAAANGRLEADIVLNENFDQDLFGKDADGNVTYNGGEIPSTFEQWDPIGSSSRPYTGTFDGNSGKAVGGVYINGAETNQGLFGYVGEGGLVQGLTVANSYVKADSYVSSIAGRNEGTIQNCENGGFVYGYFAGGIAGQNSNEIINCVNTGAIDGTGYNGGIAGYNNGGSISGSYNTASISGGSTVGGIAGSNSGTDAEVESCYNTGAVRATSSYAGGIVGRNSAAISNSYNVGAVDGGTNSGGVAGYTPGRPGNIQNCYYLDACGQSGAGTAVTIAQIEDAESADGLLAKLADGSGNGVWNTTLSAVGSWEYGKPAVQPVFIWQTPIQNTPTYFVTIPEKAEVGGEISVSITAAGALRADQQVTVSVAENTVFNLYYGGDVNNDAIAYQVFADGSKTALEAGGAVLTSGNTAEGTPSKADLTFNVIDTPKYSGTYTGTLIFTVSVKDAA